MIQTISPSPDAMESLQAFCASVSQKYHQLCRVGGGRLESHRMMEPEDDAEIERYWLAGHTQRWIAAKKGICTDTVANRLKKMGHK